MHWVKCSTCGNLTGDKEAYCPFCQQPLNNIFDTATSVSLSEPRIESKPTQLPQVNTQAIYSKEAKTVDGFVIENGILTRYCGYFVNVVIPETVVEIAPKAFDDFRQYLNSVIFPQSLKRISKNAFKDCTNLYKVVFNDQLESIGDKAFSGCKYLTNVELPDNLSSIGAYAFDSCISLTEIRIPDKITCIAPSAFYGCSSLVNVSFPDKLEIITDSAFANCCSLKSVVLPDSLESLEMRAFKNCKSIKEITIPEKCIKSKEADGVFGGEIFMGCSSLTSVTYKSEPLRIFPRMYKDCISLVEVNIPDTVEIVHENAFENCRSLVSISLSQSINTISNEAFKNCIKLERVNIPNGENLEIIMKSAFEGCSSLKNISLPKSVKTIGEKAFSECIELKEVVIPSDSQLEVIKKATFKNCHSLNRISLPKSIKFIEVYAFENCQSLSNLEIPNNSDYKLGAFINTPNLKLSIPKRFENLVRLRTAALQKGISFRNTAVEYWQVYNKFVVPTLQEFTSGRFGSDKVFLVKQDSLDVWTKNNYVTLVFIRSFDLKGFTIYDFMSYKEFAENCIGYDRIGAFKCKSNYDNISTSVNEDYSKVYALLSSSCLENWKVDVIQAPVLDSVPNSFLGLKVVAPTGKTQNFVRVQFPFKNT